MTAEEIRKIEIYGNEALMLREIAAQLAEVNEPLSSDNFLLATIEEVALYEITTDEEEGEAKP